MAVDWRGWSDELLQRARAERRPVLLFLVADWCPHCAAMEADTWADASLSALVAEHCLPVRVDAGRQPELAARYHQGGWPGTVLLDGEGAVLAGGTYLTAAEVAERVRAAARVCRGEGRHEDLPGPVPPAAVGSLSEDILPAIDRSLLADFDERHGGFGTGQKFPHAEALDYAILRHAEARNPRFHEIIEKTLTRMAEGGLHDDVDGGFFRYCSRRDWSQPHTEKLLEANAGLARNFIEAGQLMGRADFLAIGERCLEMVLRELLDPEAGLFHGGIAPDDEYYALDAAGRRTRRPPPRAGRFMADGNARAVSALLKAGAVLRRADMTDVALSVAGRLLERLWRPGRGVYHVDDGGALRLPGRLRDQAETARALLHVLQYTDERRVLPPLEDLIETLAAEHVLPDGEFGDRDERRGAPRTRRPDAAILESAVAAEVLLRAALWLGRPSLTELARRALDLHAADFRRYGYAMAAYGRSVALVLHPPLHVVVVGPPDDERADVLLRAASATYLPSRVVQRLAPSRDAALLEGLGLPSDGGPLAYVLLARECSGRFAEPDALRAGLVAANARRLTV